ncbi:hypothetical protein HPB52_024353 [Rhipicephalus sanguineus]|uniref:Uncharacterized protein n=2 Tax=Rhipicephalus sanguineus TaxID=34632 RepID=A0A9D4TCF7_RHISA|nr:hypothetical protein HPB52_008842 [Rhipicephalus sanguineus]KAH7985031.1 hypothetical protein HPB52_024353 [Rhipicephalus sanguineus]
MESTSCEKNSLVDALTVVEMRAALEQYRAELTEKDRVIADLRSRLKLQEGVNRELELQLGRFHDVLKPLTVQLTHNLQLSAGRREQYALPTGSARLKRLAISAEPVDVLLQYTPTKKVPKNDV